MGDVNIHEVCERVRSLILAEFPKGLKVVRDYDTSIPEFRGDREQLIQAVLNVVHNACQALSEQIDSGDARIVLRPDDEADVPALQGWRRELFGESALGLKHGRVALAATDHQGRRAHSGDLRQGGAFGIAGLPVHPFIADRASGRIGRPEACPAVPRGQIAQDRVRLPQRVVAIGEVRDIERHRLEIIPELQDRPIAATDSMRALGANSIDRGDVVMMTLERLSLNVPLSEVAKAGNLGELASLLHGRLTRA